MREWMSSFYFCLPLQSQRVVRSLGHLVSTWHLNLGHLYYDIYRTSPTSNYLIVTVAATVTHSFTLSHPQHHTTALLHFRAHISRWLGDCTHIG